MIISFFFSKRLFAIVIFSIKIDVVLINASVFASKNFVKKTHSGSLNMKMSKSRDIAKKSEEGDSSDSDSKIEIFKIPGSDYIKKSQISDLDIRSLVVRCTTCLHQINHHDPHQLKRHRRLNILVCNDCYNFYGDSEFSQDEAGNYNYCTWCGNGGTLYLCDFCPNPFCSTCVRRNFGRREVSLMSREGWKCFLCNPAKLKPKIAYCNLIIDYCKNNKRKQERRDKKLGVSVPDVKLSLVENQDWVLPIFDQLDDSCRSFHKHLEKLKQVGVADNKNLKKVIVKLEEIVNVHKTELSKTVKSLSNQFTLYVNDKLKAEERRKKMELRKGGDAEVVDLTEGESSAENPPEESKVEEFTSKEANGDPMEVDDGIENLNDEESSKENGEVSSKVTSEEAIEDPVEMDQTDEGNVTLSEGTNSEIKTNDKSKGKNESVEQNGNLSDIYEPDVSDMDLTDIKNSPEKDQDELKIKQKPAKLTEDPNYLAKMKLISDSSGGEDSDSLLTQNGSKDGKVSKSGTANLNCGNKSSEALSSKDDSNVSAPSNPEVVKEPSHEQTPLKVSPKKTPKITPIKQRVNRVLFSASESSDNDPLIEESADKAMASSDMEIFSDTDSKSKSRSSKGKRLKEDKAKDIDIENDSKLQLQCFVRLDNCDNLLPENETTIPVPANFIIEELNKEVDNLCKFPSKLGQKKKEGPKERKKVLVKKKPVSLAPLVESDEGSGSIQLTSDDDSTEEKKKNIEKDPNFLAKKAFSATSSEEDVLQNLSTDEEEEKKPEGSKKSQKTRQKEDDSSDDFQPTSKRRKLDKLLRKKISSSDEDKKKKEPSKEQGKSKKKKLLFTSDEDKGARDSDSSATTSETDSDEKRKKKKKRIKKRAASSSDDSVKEINEPSSTPKGQKRKNINKIIHQKDLAEETKKAQQSEKERKKRVQERQNMYNVFQEKNLEGIENKLTKFVLEIDPESKEEIVQIDPVLVTKLKPHQIRGIKFMWECTIESLKELKESKGSGCILAHCMGLGKTLQVVTFLHTCMTNPEVKKKIRTAMVICPYNTVLNWRREFDKWLGETDEDIPIHELTVAKDNPTRFDILKYWKKTGGVLIVSYDIFRRLAGKKISKMSSKNREKIHELLINPGADIVICDEGHILKNIKSAISNACLQIGTARRIVLTGTPLQNNLEEYHCMLSFVKPHLLGTLKEFRNRFVHPIVNGQYDDSLEKDVIRMKKRIHILHKLLDGCVQRCDYSALTKFLPPKYEFVISVKLSEVQAKMYKWYLENLSKAKNEAKIQGGTLFQDYNVLRNLCAHPYVVHTSFQQVQKRKLLQYDDEEMEDFINDESEEEAKKSNSGNSSEEEVIRKYKTRSHIPESNDEVSEEEVEKKEWYHQFISEENSRSVELSGKMVLLVEILKECEAVGDKLVLFSQSLLTLNSIEDILEFMDEQPVSEEDKARDIECRWVKNIDYFRMDGGTSADFRKSFIDRFNDPANDRARLFLVSTKAGGLGTNLVGANRVIMFDVSWNPSHDVQAIFRVYRFGQIKPVYIYRFLGQGTMEEKIYDRQVNKLSLSIRVVDEQQIDRHFNAAELAELYQFEPEVQRERPTPLLPKDTLLAEMLIKLKDWIVTYHEHDSLLENKTEEDLTEEERQAAWNEYENEREGRSADYVDINEEIAQYLKEPDFNLAHYEGTVIPSCKQMIENYIKTLKNRFPSDDVPTTRKKLHFMVTQLISAFREKHVKILRIKQEYCAKGSVPSTVNKYLEELNLALGELQTHYAEIRNLINIDAERARQAFLAAQAIRFQTAQPWAQAHNVNPNYFRMAGSNPAAGFHKQFIANAAKTVREQLQNLAREQFAAQQRASKPAAPRGTVITEVAVDDSVLIEEESSTTGEVQEAD